MKNLIYQYISKNKNTLNYVKQTKDNRAYESVITIDLTKEKIVGSKPLKNMEVQNKIIRELNVGKWVAVKDFEVKVRKCIFNYNDSINHNYLKVVIDIQPINFESNKNINKTLQAFSKYENCFICQNVCCF